MIYVDLQVFSLEESDYSAAEHMWKREFKRNKQGMLSAAAWLLLGYGLQQEFGKNPADFTICCGAHGKPCFEEKNGLQFNLSHSHGGVAAAVGRSPVGVDLQKIMRYDERLAHRICSEQEKQQLAASTQPAKTLYSFWAMKESYVKYTGEGMTGNFREIPYAQTARLYELSGDFVLAASSKEPLPLIYVDKQEYLGEKNEPKSI